MNPKPQGLESGARNCTAPNKDSSHPVSERRGNDMMRVYAYICIIYIYIYIYAYSIYKLPRVGGQFRIKWKGKIENGIQLESSFVLYLEQRMWFVTPLP